MLAAQPCSSMMKMTASKLQTQIMINFEAAVKKVFFTREDVLTGGEFSMEYFPCV